MLSMTNNNIYYYSLLIIIFRITHSYFFLYLQWSHLSLASRKALANGLYLIFRAVIYPERKKTNKKQTTKEQICI